MNQIYYFLIILILFIIVINLFIYVFYKKINNLEKNIIKLFDKRSNLIPSFYEVTKKYISKHENVFNEILKYRKNNLTTYNNNFLSRINEEVYIHHEINFIFKVANKHPKIQKDSKFLIIRDLFLENSNNIGNKINLYKDIVKKFNKVLKLKNLTLVGFFMGIKEKEEI